MKPRTLVFAALALISGLGTAMFARHQLSQSREHIVAEIREQPSAATYVLVAAHDLPAGSLVQNDDFVWQSWPDDRLSDAYLRKGRDDPQSLAGAVVRMRIAQGEPVGAGRVIKPGERGFLAAVLGPGMRATSIPLTATSDVAGLILPGDHVDLILSHQIPDARDPNAPARLAGETVLSNLRVVAIDQTVNDQDKKPLSGKTATFEVTPKQAEIIEVAKLIGNLSLTLRSASEPAPDSDAAKVADGPTHTWDDEVSPLMRRPERGSGGIAAVTILRGSGKSGDQSGPTAPVGGHGPGAAAVAGGVKGLTDAVMSLRNAGASLTGGL